MTGSNIPFDFLHEQGIEFDFAGDGSSSVPITSSLPASTSGRLDEHEDLELSSSLLTMSLDKDIPMDEMALSAGEKSLLARPMAEDAMAALVRPSGHLKGSSGHLNTANVGRRKGRNNSSRSRHGAANVGEHSPAGPLANVAATQPEFGIESGGVLDSKGAAAGGGARPDISVNTGNSSNGGVHHNVSGVTSDGTFSPGQSGTSSSSSSSENTPSPSLLNAPNLVAQQLNNGLSPTASMLHQLGDAYRDGLISDEQKSELKRSLTRANQMAASSSLGPANGNSGFATVSALIGGLDSAVRSPNNGGVDSKALSPGTLAGLDFDPSASADLANSGDLVDLVNSPNLLWAAGGSTYSSHSPNAANYFKGGGDDDLGVPIEQAAGVIS